MCWVSVQPFPGSMSDVFITVHNREPFYLKQPLRKFSAIPESPSPCDDLLHVTRGLSGPAHWTPRQCLLGSPPLPGALPVRTLQPAPRPLTVSAWHPLSPQHLPQKPQVSLAPHPHDMPTAPHSPCLTPHPAPVPPLLQALLSPEVVESCAPLPSCPTVTSHAASPPDTSPRLGGTGSPTSLSCPRHVATPSPAPHAHLFRRSTSHTAAPPPITPDRQTDSLGRVLGMDGAATFVLCTPVPRGPPRAFVTGIGCFLEELFSFCEK